MLQNQVFIFLFLHSYTKFQQGEMYELGTEECFSI